MQRQAIIGEIIEIVEKLEMVSLVRLLDCARALRKRALVDYNKSSG